MSVYKAYYDILNIPESAPTEQIEIAYHQQLAENSANAQLVKLIKLAYETLLELKSMQLMDSIESNNISNYVKNSSQISLEEIAESKHKNVEDWLRRQSCHNVICDSTNAINDIESDESVEIIEEVNSELVLESEFPNAQTEHNLFLTLEEIIQGCTKSVTITRKVLDANSGLLTDEEKTFHIKVKSGTPIGTRYPFSQEGNHLLGSDLPIDCVFILKDLPHSTFKRVNYSDIECTILVTEEQISNRVELQIPTLEHDPILLVVDQEMFSEDLVERFSGRGLPFMSGDQKLRGDLVVKFAVVDLVNDQVESEDKVLASPSDSVSQHQNDEPPPPYELRLKLSLEEIYFGCTKRENINGKLITVSIPPGSVPGTQIPLPNENAVFTIEAKPHAIFKCTSNKDIEYTAKITAQEAILGCTLSIPTLDAPIELKVDGGVTPKTVKRIEGRGLPTGNDTRGDLLVRFEIIFQQEKPQDPTIEHDLQVTLNQYLNGHRKRVRITRKVINAEGEEGLENKILVIDIKPGTPSGTRFTFPREGDQNRNAIPADIVFTLRDKPHNHFKREGVDLRHILKVKESQLKLGEVFKVPTLDNGTRSVVIDDHLLTHKCCTFASCGLPLPEKPSQRGDLVVDLEVEPEFKPKNPPIRQELLLSLENILNGALKRVKVTRKVFDQYGDFQQFEQTVSIKIDPGTAEGAEFTIPNLGDQYPNSESADFVYVARYKPHPIFTVNGSDVEYFVQKIESEVKKDFRLSIPTLDGSYFDSTFKNICAENGVVRFANLGLPLAGSKLRGDLVVRFEILPDDRKDPPVEHQLPLSLENILQGCSKRMKIRRLVIDSNGAESEVEKIVTMHVTPGTLAGKKFVYPNEGDQRPGRIPADVIFSSVDKPHKVFTRFAGCDLLYTAQISEAEAADGAVHLEIPTMEGLTHQLTIHKAIEANSQIRIPGKGLPKSFNPRERGDIVVKFEIIKEKNESFKFASLFSKKESNHLSKTNAALEMQKMVDKPAIEDAKESKTQNGPSVSKPLQDFLQTMLPQKDEPKLDDPIFQFLPLYLENVYHGANLQVKFTRKTFDKDEQTIVKEEEVTFPIVIAPGTKVGTSFHFPQAGHHIPGKKQRDVVYVTSDAPHHLFERNGVDLLFTSKIHSNQTHPGTTLEIPTMDNDKPLMLVVNRQIQADTVITLPNYGLPYPDDVKKFGNLLVKFEIIDLENVESHDTTATSNRDPPLEYELPLTLQEILKGCIKTKPFRRSIFNDDGSETIEEDLFTIKINPGVPSGSRFRFPRQGSRFPGRVPQDIVFTAVDRTDAIFERDGANLVHTITVSREQMKKNVKIKIPTLDNVYLKKKVPTLLSTVYTIPDRGLPYPDNSEKRGKLVVKFKLDEDNSSSKRSSLLCLR